MIPKHAIELAIEGGWKAPQENINWESHWEILALDPSFWECLGKALGWNKKRSISESIVDGVGYTCVSYNDESGRCDEYEETWRVVAKNFYDLILTNQPTDAFWASLLPHSPHHEE